MELVKFEMTKEQLNNLITFLDRVDYKGFQEIGAVQEIMVALQNPTCEKENVIDD